MLLICVAANASLIVADLEDAVPIHEKPKALQIIKENLPKLREAVSDKSVSRSAQIVWRLVCLRMMFDLSLKRALPSSLMDSALPKLTQHILIVQDGLKQHYFFLNNLNNRSLK